jgi:hypothetical protein
VSRSGKKAALHLYPVVTLRFRLAGKLDSQICCGDFKGQGNRVSQS